MSYCPDLRNHNSSVHTRDILLHGQHGKPWHSVNKLKGHQPCCKFCTRRYPLYYLSFQLSWKYMCLDRKWRIGILFEFHNYNKISRKTFSNSEYFDILVILLTYHTAWIWIWMTKRWGDTSDKGFIFKKMNWSIKEKKNP